MCVFLAQWWTIASPRIYKCISLNLYAFFCENFSPLGFDSAPQGVSKLPRKDINVTFEIKFVFLEIERIGHAVARSVG